MNQHQQPCFRALSRQTENHHPPNSLKLYSLQAINVIVIAVLHNCFRLYRFRPCHILSRWSNPRFGYFQWRRWFSWNGDHCCSSTRSPDSDCFSTIFGQLPLWKSSLIWKFAPKFFSNGSLRLHQI